MATRFVANRTFTSLRAIYSHFNATTKAEKESARTQAYGSLRRSSRGREVIGEIEKRRAASRKAAETRKAKKQAFTLTVSEFFAADEYPSIEPDYSRNYSQRHAYVIRLQYAQIHDTARGEKVETTYVMVTILSDTALTIDELDASVWEQYGQDAMLPDRYGIDLVDWQLIAHYINRGAK
jgi:hypothetical protein